MKDLFDGVDRRLGVQCIKDRLDHEDISAAIEQPFGRYLIAVCELIEGDVARPGPRRSGSTTPCGWSGRGRRSPSASSQAC